jgi:nuclear cap-binding protein subunit 2
VPIMSVRLVVILPKLRPTEQPEQPESLNDTQNKRRRFNDREDEKPEEPDDKLKNATTLYVGNL